jgi:hypothetical protein
MFCCIYDSIAKVIAAQRFPALAALALARKCHEMCGCITFYEILGGLLLTAVTGTLLPPAR